MKKEDFEKFKDFDDGSGTISYDWVIAQVQGGKQPFTEGQLNEIIESFKTQTVKVPLTITHGKTGKLKSWASFGWPLKLWKEGKRLCAQMSMNKTIHKVLEMDLLKNRSIGIVKDEKTGKWRLDHIALLGAELPAIKGMPDLAYSEDFEGVEIIEFQKEPKIENKGEKHMELKYTQEQLDSLIQAAVDKAVNAKEAELTTNFSNKEAEITKKVTDGDTKIKELETEITKKDVTLKEFSDKVSEAEAVNFVEKLIQDRKLMPAQKDATVKLLTGARNYSADYFKELKESYESMPPVIEFGEVDGANGEEFPGKGDGKVTEMDGILGISEKDVKKYSDKNFNPLIDGGIE